MSVTLDSFELDPFTLKRARKGDRAACERIYRQFQQPAYTTAYRVCGCPQLAQDVIQEAFINAFRRIRQYRGDSVFWAWLKRIVVNQAISTLRRQPSRETVEWSEHLAGQASEEPRPDLQTDLEAAFHRLDDDDRAVVWLYDVEGYSHSEIAAFFDMTESFSKTRLSRARARLREWLQDSLQGPGGSGQVLVQSRSGSSKSETPPATTNATPSTIPDSTMRAASDLTRPACQAAQADALTTNETSVSECPQTQLRMKPA